MPALLAMSASVISDHRCCPSWARAASKTVWRSSSRAASWYGARWADTPVSCQLGASIRRWRPARNRPCRGPRSRDRASRRAPGSTAYPLRTPRAGVPPPRRRRSRSWGNARRSCDPPVALQPPPELARMDVAAGDVAFVVVEQARVHPPSPQRREPGEDDHPGVSRRQLRRLFDVAQGLVAPGRVGVVVGVTLQVVEEDVGGDVVAVPAVLGAAAVVAH